MFFLVILSHLVVLTIHFSIPFAAFAQSVPESIDLHTFSTASDAEQHGQDRFRIKQVRG
jgi:hypothetical protein